MSKKLSASGPVMGATGPLLPNAFLIVENISFSKAPTPWMAEYYMRFWAQSVASANASCCIEHLYAVRTRGAH